MPVAHARRPGRGRGPGCRAGGPAGGAGAHGKGVALPELSFSALCRIARALFDVPFAAIHVAGAGVWTDRDDGFDGSPEVAAGAPDACPAAGLVPLWVPDARLSEPFAGWPCVTGAPGVRFLARILFGAGGIGRLVLLDSRVRVAASDDFRRLEDLAAAAGECLRLWQLARETAKREADFRLLAETTTDTIVRGSLDGIRLYVSPSVRALLGYGPEELIGRRAAELVHPDDAAGFRTLMEEIRTGRMDVGVTEHRQRHRDGSWVWMEASIRLTRDPETGAPTGYVASVRGISRRKELEVQLERLASHDELTGLPNRILFGRQLDDSVAESHRTGRGFMLFYMDLDHFKQVNDTLGHHAGDAVLREVASRFRALLRTGDLVARLGGDEFAALLPALGSAEAEALANRLIAAIGRPILVDGREIRIGLSVGIARGPQAGAGPDELLSRADRALYAAKAAGRHTVRFFEGLA